MWHNAGFAVTKKSDPSRFLVRKAYKVAHDFAMRLDQKSYPAFESYEDVLVSFGAVCRALLFEFDHQGQDVRNRIIRNFIARTGVLTRAIYTLWRMQDYQDAWVLHRCLMDRLFHLHHLADKNEFKMFEAWSFMKQYNALNAVRSEPEFDVSRDGPSFTATAERKERAKTLSASRQEWEGWKRPKAEEVAKQLDMRFLYKYGYDFASAHTHPMANDGSMDFFITTGIEPAEPLDDQRAVLFNTLIVATMLVKEGLVASKLLWHKAVVGFLDDMLAFVKDGSGGYKERCLSVAKIFEAGERLSQKKS